MGTAGGILRTGAALATGLSLVLMGTAGEGDPIRILPYPTPYPGHRDTAAAAGDVNGDGTPDFLVGLPDGIDDFSGSVAVVVSGWDGSILRTFEGPGTPGDDFGVAVAVLGDIDGRGSRDFLVGAPGGQTLIPELGQPTYAMVFAGEDGAVLFDSGPMEATAYGSRISALPDLDGDGAQEFAIGEGDPFWQSPTAITIHSGGTGLPLHRFEFPVTDEGGSAVVPLADQDGDGLPDLAVGYPGPSGGVETEAGRVAIVSGATFAEIRSIPGRWRGVVFGPGILPFGTPDEPSSSFLAPGWDRRRRASALLRVDAKTGRVICAVRPDDPYVYFGDVHGLGDQDGDGVREVLATTYSQDRYGGIEVGGLVQVHSGATGRLLFSRQGWGANEDRFNQTVPAGDFDGDGREDLVRRMPGPGRIQVEGVDLAPCPESVHVALQRAPGAPDASSRGHLDARIDFPLLVLRVSTLLPNNQTVPAYLVWLEDGPGTGSFDAIGELRVDARNGRGRAHSGTVYSSIQGDLPCLTSPSLGGRAVEVRDYGGTVFLAARIPSQVFEASSERADLLPPGGAPFPAATAEARVVAIPRRGSLRLSVLSRGLPPGLGHEVWVEESPGSGILEIVGSLTGARLALDTARGDHLPGAAPDAASLSGRAIEIRDGDAVLLRGTLP